MAELVITGNEAEARMEGGSLTVIVLTPAMFAMAVGLPLLATLTSGGGCDCEGALASDGDLACDVWGDSKGLACDAWDDSDIGGLACDANSEGLVREDSGNGWGDGDGGDLV